MSLSAEFVKYCKTITAKRPRTVIEHILKYGYITTEELRDKYGYNHPPRAARDVRENGIPLITFRVTASDGRNIAAYMFGDYKNMRFTKLAGRTVLSSRLKMHLMERDGRKCQIYLEELPERDLQIDHRVPYEVAGEGLGNEQDLDNFMLLSSSANRAKSWSCEHCQNWVEIKDIEVCKKCYWAYPENYFHVAMNGIRRADIMWSGEEIAEYEKIKKKANDLGKDCNQMIREIVRENL